MLDIAIQVRMQIAVIEVKGMHVTKDRAAFERLSDCAAAYRAKYAGDTPDSLGAIDGVQVARRLFRELGMDPTKTRPACEALLRRALKGQSLFCINTLVDVVNWCSLDFLLPICVYDRDKISGSVVIRPGEPDETYRALTGKEVNLHDRYVLADEMGPFGNPVTDSLRTAIGEDTTGAIAVVFAPTDYRADDLTACAGTTADRIMEFCGGKVERISLHQP
jgi:DNA/RNA-binding domain of Phe-tRNA-synthetase-like protein